MLLRYLSVICLTFVAIGVPCAAQSYVELPIEEKERKHWSFQKPVRPVVPQVKNSAWVTNPIDAFILAKLENANLGVSSAADKTTLLRRVTFDLTGLPPTPAEITDFLNDHRPDAYKRVVERLLASPHYGERWGQYWLDVVRYAESNGFEGDAERPYAWRYRDYVIRSLNDDKPYDRFLMEQIAGDALAVGKEVRPNVDLWIATGMHRCGPVHVVSGNVDPEENRNEVLTEMVSGIGSAVLGITLHCARCHDHKFDPISQADYYRLEAFFASTKYRDVDFSLADERSTFQKSLVDIMVKVAPIKSQVVELDAPYQKKLREMKRANLEPQYKTALDADPKKRTPEQQKLAKDAEALIKVSWDEVLAVLTPADREKRTALRAKQHALEAQLPLPPSMAWAIVDDGQSVPTYILKRGEVKRKLITVEPNFPRVLEPGLNEIKPHPRALLAPFVGGVALPPARLTRLDLAKRLTAPDHPLTARVFVNRLWQHHFGRGIVGTPNDYGIRGEKPTHPELLDWLATEFVQNGWKIKDMHRLMVMSNTYRQSSKAPTMVNTVDPDNKLLWRMNRRRLEAEQLRDAILTAAGTLNPQLGGPMVKVPLEPEVYDLIFTEGEPDGLWATTPDARQHTRRSIYLFAKRNVRLPLFEAFDQPDRLSSCADRSISIFAPQALILMNGPFTQSQSRAMAAEILRQVPEPSWEKRIEAGYRRALGRSPTAEETKLAITFLKDQAESTRDRLLLRRPVTIPENLPKDADLADAVALAELCRALINTNEFVYVP